MKRYSVLGSWAIVQALIMLISDFGIVHLAVAESQAAPGIQILEIIPSSDNATAAETVRFLDKPKNSEIIVGQDVSLNSRLVLKCNATRPVQFIYIGAGRPEFSTYTNVRWGSDKPEAYEAEASLGLLGFHDALREEDSGNYTCRYIEDSSILSYYYVYVPGASIFTSPDGYDTDVFITPKDKSVRIPCSVTHPNASVSLYRTANGKLQCPALDEKRATYDSKKGFMLNLKDLKSPAGTYVCLASFDNAFRMIEYQLVLSNSTEGSPCNRSPCGSKAECSVVDGYPVCYCFRGLSGNPYSECMMDDKKRCQTSKDCSKGMFCTQGQCTKDPCSPSPCGKGSRCESVQGRARCSCLSGFAGKVPYCRKRCMSNYECGDDEFCTGNICQNPCPGSCGKNAACEVVQDKKGKRIECSCDSGYFGDAKKECLAVSCSRNSDCPANGYCDKGKCQVDLTGGIGVGNNTCSSDLCGINAECRISKTTLQPKCTCRPGSDGDPYEECYGKCPASFKCGIGAICRVSYRRPETEIECYCPLGTTGNPAELCTNETLGGDVCPQNNPCAPGSQCQLRRSSRFTEEQPFFVCFGKCPRNFRCGINANCRVSYESGQPQNECYCPLGTSGDAYDQCFKEPVSVIPTSAPPPPPDLCFRNNPCPVGSECVITRSGEVDCKCPAGFRGTPPSCTAVLQRCMDDRDCENKNAECIGGQCIDECVFKCGVNAVCEGRGTRMRCICMPGFIEDNTGGCSPSIDPCTPSPCGEFALCFAVEGTAQCNCILGYEKDRLTGRCKIRPPYPTSPSVLPPESDDEDFRPIIIEAPDNLSSRRMGRDECDLGTGRFRENLRQCERGLECQRDWEGVARCLPPPSVENNYCQDDRDCLEPEVCSNFTCFNPCHPSYSHCASVAFAECRVIERRALCTCQRGYVGDPYNRLGCKPETIGDRIGRSSPVVPCDLRQLRRGRSSGCDSRSECQFVNGRSICMCAPEYEGVYPDCRLLCRSNLDCPDDHSCMDYQCIDPCKNNNACGRNAICRVYDHRLECECPKGFSGNARVGCYPGRSHVVKPRGLHMNCTGNRCTFF